MQHAPDMRLSAEKKYLARDIETEGVRVTRSRGSYVYAADRRKYVDFVSGWCVGNFGWDNPRLRARVRRFTGPDYVFPGFSYSPWVELAKLLAQITPGKLTKSFRATGGSEAVDIALQAAMVHTGRKRFLSIEGAYHGNSLAALSVGDDGKDQKGIIRKSHKIALPLDMDALDRVETQLKRRDVAGFIMEPVIINLGVCLPEPGFMEGLQRLCRRYGTLLIMDEVATGFGRTGRIFGSEHHDIEPDIMCMAKAITGGVAEMGATISTGDIGESMEEEGTFYSTFGWHPLSVDVAIANVRYIMRNKKSLLETVAGTSAYFRDRLSSMDFGEDAKLNIVGLAIGVDVQDEKLASKIQRRCRDRGVLVTAEEKILMLLPALNIPRPVAKRGLDILEDAVASVRRAR